MFSYLVAHLVLNQFHPHKQKYSWPNYLKLKSLKQMKKLQFYCVLMDVLALKRNSVVQDVVNTKLLL